MRCERRSGARRGLRTAGSPKRERSGSSSRSTPPKRPSKRASSLPRSSAARRSCLTTRWRSICATRRASSTPTARTSCACCAQRRGSRRPSPPSTGFEIILPAVLRGDAVDPNIEEHRISDVAMLERLYGMPAGAAVEKELAYIHPHYRRLIEASPFVVLATCGPDGLDTSPRGDPAGFVAVEDEH